MKRNWIIAASLMYAITANAGAYGKLDISVKAAGESVNVRIIGEIYNGWSEESFRSKMDAAKEAGAKDVNLYVNSIGGSVFSASEIVNIINEFVKETGGTVKGQGGAIVASAATFIAVHCTSFSMASNGSFMIHKPSGVVRGTADEIESSVKLLRNLEQQYADAYAAKTGMKSDSVKALYAKGDYWMTASEAVKNKFIDSVDGKAVIDEETKAMFQACGRELPEGSIPNNTNPHNKQKTKMELSLLIAMLGMDVNSTEAQVQARLRDLMQKNAEYAALLKQNETAAVAAKSSRIDAVIDAAVESKKIHADAKGYYRSQLLAAANLDTAIAEIEAMEAPKSLAGGVQEAPKGESKGIPADRKSWTFAEWNEKDANGLKALAETDEEAYLKLYNAHYNTNRKSLK